MNSDSVASQVVLLEVTYGEWVEKDHNRNLAI